MMRMKQSVKLLVLGLLVVGLVGIITVGAAGSIDAGKTDATLTVQFLYRGDNGETPLPVSGASFSLYRVGDVSDSGTSFTPVEGYEQSATGVDFADLNDNTGTVLAGYVGTKQIQPDARGKTDGDGIQKFTELTPGLYLVSGERCEMDGYYYDSTPYLVAIPALAQDSQQWNYDPVTNPKCERTKKEEKPPVSYKALKVWDDKGGEKYRPESVTVHLLRNGVDANQTVLLDADNGWTYTWDNLDSDCTWTVFEEPIEDYTVNIELVGVTFKVTNTIKPELVGKPDDSNLPTDDDPNKNPIDSDDTSSKNQNKDTTKTDTTAKSTTTKTPTTTTIKTPTTKTTVTNTTNKTSTKLPQTGQLWWPVPVLAGCGLVSLGVGVVRRKED